MELSLPLKYQKLIDERVRTGEYATREEVVIAALTTLIQSEQFGSFAPGELDYLIDEGEKSLKRDGAISGTSVFRSIRQRSAGRRGK